MPLVKNAEIVDDPFIHAADGDELPGDGAILITAVRFLADPETLLRRAGKLGVIWANNRELGRSASAYVDAETALDQVARVRALAVEGEGHIVHDPRSGHWAWHLDDHGALLRERHGFKGELRATGQVLRDQFVFMMRAGFDAFEVRKESDAEAFASTAKRYSVFYQPTGDGRVTALNRRMQLRHSESAGQ